VQKLESNAKVLRVSQMALRPSCSVDIKLTQALRQIKPTAVEVLYTETPEGCRVAASHCLTQGKTPFMHSSQGRVRLQEVQWKLKHGKVPKGKLVTETCKTRGCLCLAHLAALMHSEIVLIRGKHKQGEENGRAKLTAQQAAIIKNSPAASREDMADQFGVSIHTVQDIRAGKLWKKLVVDEHTPTYTPSPELLARRARESPWLRMKYDIDCKDGLAK
jgi:hypothetical protein